jgi:hypothetical protein
MFAEGKMKKNEIEKEVNKFLQIYPEFSEEAAQAFMKKYYLKGLGGSLGSKFSERVFRSWILKALEEKVYEPVKRKSFKFSLILDGKVITDNKKPDMYIKRKEDNKEILVEFKCDIDNIEKDLFKLYFSDEKFKKILFVWENWDNGESTKGGKGSYLKILEAFQGQHNIDFVYMPIFKDKKMTDIKEKLKDKFDELINKILE